MSRFYRDVRRYLMEQEDLEEKDILAKTKGVYTIIGNVNKVINGVLADFKGRIEDEKQEETFEEVSAYFKHPEYSNALLLEDVNSFKAIQKRETIDNLLNKKWSKIHERHKEAFMIYYHGTGLNEFHEDEAAAMKDRRHEELKEKHRSISSVGEQKILDAVERTEDKLSEGQQKIQENLTVVGEKGQDRYRFLKLWILALIVLSGLILANQFFSKPEPETNTKLSHAELISQLSFEDSLSFKLLIVPFDDEKDSKKGEENAQQLYYRFENIRQTDSLNIEVRFIDDLEEVGYFKQAKDIVEQSEIDMIVWGKFDEGCGKHDKICLNYTVSRETESENSQILSTNGSTGTKDIDGSMRLYNGYLQESIDDIVFWVVANYHYSKHDHEKALVAIQKIVRPNECKPEVYAQAALWANEIKNREIALSLLKSSITCKLIGRSLPDISLEELYSLKAIDTTIVDTSLAWYWYDLGQVISWENSKAYQYIPAYEKSIKILPNYSSPLGRLGSIYKGYDNQKAISYFERLEGSSREFYLPFLGGLYEEVGDYKKAADCYLEGIDDNEDYLAYNKLAVLLANSGDTAQAMRLLEKAVKGHNWLRRSWHNKGMLHAHMKQFRKAVECFDNAIKETPEWAISKVPKAIAYDSLGEYSKALETLIKAAKDHPNSAFILKPLREHYLRDGQIENANECSRKLAELKSDSLKSV